ncbi:uncharacterized protein Z520_06927 [Fonsecaea multimorphosa CBS 102226]|uniref:RTA1 domain protein n=1 Tax=Fonsecaea multimorphosa CBS 102226 TaxID=1442371 RepID=A0A0D2H6K9_9EURO|nr:uncharacterized protein Z520_06927 [Fonsecaea multimorphosa CBS 102226]KIX97475.1 hypothetical protein Z520_06927 [Fonsecaea multimorphosa CBS 102226]OAL23438.1 hypothetical protein AYO22_06488 [Fonsecaea multimorphosa]
MNSTFDPANCTYATCSVQDYGQLRYIPSLAGNAFYLAVFCLACLLQIYLGLRYRTWGFMFGMLGGIGLEIMGYVSRIQLHYDDFNNTYFIIYLVGLTIGPAFFSGAIYICLARIIAVYGLGVSLLSPRAITVVFVGCDFVSLVLQAAGGALASLDISPGLEQTGINLMIAGLASQVASTTVFCGLCLQIVFSIHKRAGLVNRNSAALRRKLAFKLFLSAIAISTVAILIRCSFRVAELSHGFGSAIANDETKFMVLDGAMMALAVLALSVGHPGPALGEVMWAQGGFKLLPRSKRPKKTRQIAYGLSETMSPVGFSLREIPK